MAKIQVRTKATLLTVIDSYGNIATAVYEEFESAIQICGLEQPDPDCEWSRLPIPSWQDDAKHFGTDGYCEEYKLGWSSSEVEIVAEVELNQDYRTERTLRA